MSRHCSFLCLLIVAIAHAVAHAGTPYWNQFRGPTGDGQAAAKNLPVEFDEAKNVRWKISVPGVGWSSPVVWDNQIWLTSGREDGRELFAICVDADSGTFVHNIKVFDVANPAMEWSNQNPHASPTPFVEEGRVYVHYGSYGTACVDTSSGDIVWKRQDLKCNHRVGPASSPIIHGDSLFLHFDGVDVQFVVALDKASGKTRWRKRREVNSDLATRLREAGLSESSIEGTLKKKPGDNRKSYATATLIDYQGKQQLISPGAEVLFSYDPYTGEELWRVELSGWAWNVACRPILANGLIYVTTGISKKLLAVSPDGSGDVTRTHVVWSTGKGAPNLSSPLIVDDLLIMVGDSGGISTCLDANTGAEIWRKRLGGNHWASPLYAGGNVYFSSKEGDVTVLATSKTESEIKVLAKNKLHASFIASPAVAGDSLILRSTTHLYCLANGYERTAEEVAQDTQPKSDARRGSSDKPETDAAKLSALATRLKELVTAGKLTREEAIELYQLAAGPDSQAKGKQRKPDDKPVDLEELAARLKAAVRDGKMNAADATAAFKKAAAQQKNAKSGTQRKGQGKGKTAAGETRFYAIVIGRLKSKDIELGEFTFEVDYATSMGGNRWVKNKIVGKTVKVTGVSGAFRDKLLLIKRGETLQVRTGSYFADSNSLGFGYKFHVLERTQPFEPAAFGVPPKEFRGFRGILQGKIIEVGGYEVLLHVDEIVKVSDGNKADDADSIKGKRVRLVGFYNQHRDAFADLHAGDTIRVSVTHADPTHDEFNVTDTLEKIGKE